MTHDEFVTAYRAGAIRVEIDPAQAADFVSARLLLPLVRLPVLGVGVGLALIGWIWTGVLIIAAGTLAPLLIKRSAPHFVMTEALENGRFYEEVAGRGILRIVLRNS